MQMEKLTAAAKTLGVSKVFLHRKIRSGVWPFYRLGARAIVVDIDEIRALTRKPAVKDSAGVQD